MNLKEENEKLQALLCDIDKYLDRKGISRNSLIRKNIAKSLSYQDSHCVASPAQDEREAFKRALHSQKVFKLSSATIDAAEWAWFNRPN